MTENEIAKEVVDAAYKDHTTLGPGLLESVYEASLAHELGQRGLKVERQTGGTVSMPVKTCSSYCLGVFPPLCGKSCQAKSS